MKTEQQNYKLMFAYNCKKHSQDIPYLLAELDVER